MKRVPPKESQKIISDPEEAKKYTVRAEARGPMAGRMLSRLLMFNKFESGRILDAGTGSGMMAIELAKSFPRARIVAVDLSEPLLEIAKIAAAPGNLSKRITFEKADIQALPYGDDSFDVIICLATLRVVDDPIAMLNEFERVLRPGGKFLINDAIRSWRALFFPPLRSAYSKREIEGLFEKSNLRSCNLRVRNGRMAILTNLGMPGPGARGRGGPRGGMRGGGGPGGAGGGVA